MDTQHSLNLVTFCVCLRTEIFDRFACPMAEFLDKNPPFLTCIRYSTLAVRDYASLVYLLS